MEVILPSMPPYLPSLRWMILQDSPIKTREYTRTLIESNTPEGMVLTVPVVGGSSAVKRLSPSRLKVSSHGDWPRIHLGAIEAAYGREPYFQHYFPAMAEIIANHPLRLKELNEKILFAMLSGINYEENIVEIEEMRKSHPRRYGDIRSRLMGKVDPDHSLIEPLFRLGPDAVFLL